MSTSVKILRTGAAQCETSLRRGREGRGEGAVWLVSSEAVAVADMMVLCAGALERGVGGRARMDPENDDVRKREPGRVVAWDEPAEAVVTSGSFLCRYLTGNPAEGEEREREPPLQSKLRSLFDHDVSAPTALRLEWQHLVGTYQPTQAPGRPTPARLSSNPPSCSRTSPHSASFVPRLDHASTRTSSTSSRSYARPDSCCSVVRRAPPRD